MPTITKQVAPEGAPRLDLTRDLLRDFADADEGTNQYRTTAACLFTYLSGACHDVLIQLYRGPRSDGDLASKSGRDELVDLGLAARVIINQEFGWNALTALGGHLVRGFAGLYQHDDVRAAAAFEEVLAQSPNGPKRRRLGDGK